MSTSIITLSTDLGLTDHFVASVKGVIYKVIPDARIVDISHNIKTFSIAQTAFLIRNSYKDFPKGTIHIIGVKPESTTEIKHLVAEYEGQYFICADNGFLSLAFGKPPEKIHEISLKQASDNNNFPIRDVFAPVACHIANGGTIEVLGNKVGEIKLNQFFTPKVENGLILGRVIYIDHYGNIYVNITPTIFKQYIGNKKFIIYFRTRRYAIKKLHTTYSDVVEGERVAFFGSTGFLEIAIYNNVNTDNNLFGIRKGNGADKLLGINVQDEIRIETDDYKNGKNEFSPSSGEGFFKSF